jgi:uncharacterized protein (UPF0332 family)
VSDAAAHLVKAREAIRFAPYALDGDYAEEAGRSAYMAAYHAAQSLIVARTGKSPKTHSGTRSEFARLSQNEPTIAREYVALLSWSYELKNAADYDQEPHISNEEAARAIAASSVLVDAIAELLDLT